LTLSSQRRYRGAMPAPRPAQSLQRSACALLLALAAAGAWAAPDAPEAGDPIANLLVERGLLQDGPAEATAAPRSRPWRERASDWTADLVIEAMNFLGVHYRRGGSSAEQGFDCSGFTRHVFESTLGLVLPRRSQEQARAPGLASVERTELRPGDLVFFNTLRAAFSHVGIYIGDGKFIHSPRSGAQVRVEDMRLAYWTQRYDGARRANPPAPEPAPADAAR
jgi:cell wall-associated NlpC family hydrolase